MAPGLTLMAHSRSLPGLIDQLVLCSFFGGVGDDQVQREKGHNGKEEKEILFFYKRVVIWPAACVTYCIIITGQDATVRVIYGRVIYFHVFGMQPLAPAQTSRASWPCVKHFARLSLAVE
jgi:hypothetical protein